MPLWNSSLKEKIKDQAEGNSERREVDNFYYQQIKVYLWLPIFSRRCSCGYPFYFKAFDVMPWSFQECLYYIWIVWCMNDIILASDRDFFFPTLKINFVKILLLNEKIVIPSPTCWATNKKKKRGKRRKEEEVVKDIF